MTTRIPTRRAALAAVTGVASVFLAACGGGGGHAGHGASASVSVSVSVSESPSPSPSASVTATAHNAQDVAFAQGMIPHHRQALEMARLADGRAFSARVKDLAARIEKAQDPEIRTMTGWLKAWGEQTPTAGTAHSGHAGMSGTMGDDDMAALKEATGKDFDTKFLSLMVEHHQGAVAMATTEKGKGRYGPAKGMADAIVSAQNAEIEEMKRLLGKN